MGIMPETGDNSAKEGSPFLTIKELEEALSIKNKKVPCLASILAEIYKWSDLLLRPFNTCVEERHFSFPLGGNDACVRKDTLN